MIQIKIDSLSFKVKSGISILEACRFIGIKIPRFCYHESLSISGNCRMCLVKLERDDKLIISCLTSIEPNMEIVSNDASIKKAREEIVEFLLLDHPLDCPICDQGGECDLQDQAKTFGSTHSKFFLNKVGVEDKEFSPFIKTIMTRCIHCTRCVRFSSEIAGVDFFGTLNRGNSTEIGVYSTNTFNSEISGNVIDLCPVGSLTSKPYTFKSRPWELRVTETIDLTDSLGSNIYANFIDSKITRILPKLNSNLNGSIISDKARFIYDAFSDSKTLQEITQIKNTYLKQKSNIFKLTENVLASIKSDKNVLFLINEDLSLENINFFKKIVLENPNIILRVVNSSFNLHNKNVFLNSNTYLKDLESGNKNCFLFSTNPKIECTLINIRLRYLTFHQYLNSYSFGYKFGSTLKNSFLNCNLLDILKLFEGKSNQMSNLLSEEKTPLFIFGSSFKLRGINLSTLNLLLKKINPSSIFFNILPSSNSSSVGFENVNSLSYNDVLKSKTVFFINLDESIFLKKLFMKQNAIISSFWLNTHSSDFIIKNGFEIPINNIYQEKGLYLNLELRPQKSEKIISNSKESVSIYPFFISLVKIKKVKNTYLNFLKEVVQTPKKFTLSSSKLYLSKINNLNKYYNVLNKISTYNIKPKFTNFFNTNHYTKFSKNMLVASQEFDNKFNNFF